MIIILEGAHGSGKTTLAVRLGMVTRWPVYRPFRAVGIHSDSERESAAAFLSLNTWREELFEADLLSVLWPRGGIILDRSMPSGLAYDSKLSPHDRLAILRLWASRMKAARNAVIILVETAAETAKQRARGHAIPISEEADRLRELCATSGLPMITLDGNRDPDTVYKRAISGISEHVRRNPEAAGVEWSMLR